MAKINKFVTSQIEGTLGTPNVIHPLGLAFDSDGVIFFSNGAAATTQIMAPGIFYGSGKDSSDGGNLNTLKLIPDYTSYVSASDQYLVIDPISSDRIHIRTGLLPNASTADLVLGGIANNVRVSDSNSSVQFTVTNSAQNFNYVFQNGSFIVPVSLVKPPQFPRTFEARLEAETFYSTVGNPVFGGGEGWVYNFTFSVDETGTVTTTVDDPLHGLDYGYNVGDTFRFTEQHHGIRDYDFDVVITDIQLNTSPLGYLGSLSVSPPPTLAPVFESQGPVKFAAGSSDYVFGTNGQILFANNSSISEGIRNTSLSNKSSIELRPSMAFGNQKFVINGLETNGLQIGTGSLPSVSMTIGDEEQFVKLHSNGNISLASYNRDDQSAGTWHIVNDGTFRSRLDSVYLKQETILDSNVGLFSANLYPMVISSGDSLTLKSGFGAYTWKFGTDGNLTLPSGMTIGGSTNTAIISPPTAAAGQSLVLRPTAATWSITSSGNIVYGSSITISINLLSFTYFGTVNYEITGPGVTQQTLGRALTGNVVFAGVPNPDTKTVTWTIPANSNITEFTFTLTTVDGTRSTGPGETDPALYYNFELNAMPTGGAITVTNDGVSNTEFSHIHLLAGDPASVDLYLGDDDQYVKIEKNAGNVVIGTNSNTKNWTFSTDGNLTLPNNTKIAPVAPTGYRQTFTQDVYGNTNTGAVSGLTVIDLGSNSQLLALLDPNSQFGNNQYNLYHPITITYSDLTTQTFTTARCTSLLGGFIQFGYNDSTAGHSFPITLQTSNYSSGGTLINVNNNTWKFDQTGNLTLPQTNMMASPAPTSLPGITFSDGTFQTTAYTGAAAKVDITNTNGLTTTYYPTFVESRINGQYMRADVDLTYRTDDNLLRSGNIQVGRNIYGSHLGGISNAIQLRPNIDIDKRFLFTVDSSGGNYIRSGMEMPVAEVDKAVTLGFPHTNGTVSYIYNQGTDTNGTEWNDALVIFQNGGNVKIGTITSGNGTKIWEFNQTGKIRFPDTTQQSTAWTGNINTTNGYINFTASPAPGTSGITFADGTTQTTAYTATSEQKFDIKATSFGVVGNTRYGVNTASGAVIATLPASPGLGDAVFFADAGGAFSTNSLTIARNGNTIMGSAADIVINTNGDSLGLFWNGTTWRLYE